jgi:hypothetical protein
LAWVSATFARFSTPFAQLSSSMHQNAAKKAKSPKKVKKTRTLKQVIGELTTIEKGSPIPDSESPDAALSNAASGSSRGPKLSVDRLLAAMTPLELEAIALAKKVTKPRRASNKDYQQVKIALRLNDSQFERLMVARVGCKKKRLLEADWEAKARLENEEFGLVCSPVLVADIETSISKRQLRRLHEPAREKAHRNHKKWENRNYLASQGEPTPPPLRNWSYKRQD